MENAPLLGKTSDGTSAIDNVTDIEKIGSNTTGFSQQRRIIYAGLSVLCTIVVLLVTLTALSTPDWATLAVPEKDTVAHLGLWSVCEETDTPGHQSSYGCYSQEDKTGIQQYFGLEITTNGEKNIRSLRAYMGVTTLCVIVGAIAGGYSLFHESRLVLAFAWINLLVGSCLMIVTAAFFNRTKGGMVVSTLNGGGVAASTAMGVPYLCIALVLAVSAACGYGYRMVHVGATSHRLLQASSDVPVALLILIHCILAGIANVSTPSYFAYNLGLFAAVVISVFSDDVIEAMFNPVQGLFCLSLVCDLITVLVFGHVLFFEGTTAQRLTLCLSCLNAVLKPVTMTALYLRRRWGSGGAVTLMLGSKRRTHTPNTSTTASYGSNTDGAVPVMAQQPRTGPIPGSYGAAPQPARRIVPAQPVPVPPVPVEAPQSDPTPTKRSWMSRFSRKKAVEIKPQVAEHVPTGPQPGSYGMRPATTRAPIKTYTETAPATNTQPEATVTPPGEGAAGCSAVITTTPETSPSTPETVASVLPVPVAPTPASTAPQTSTMADGNGKLDVAPNAVAEVGGCRATAGDDSSSDSEDGEWGFGAAPRDATHTEAPVDDSNSDEAFFTPIAGDTVNAHGADVDVFGGAGKGGSVPKGNRSIEEKKRDRAARRAAKKAAEEDARRKEKAALEAEQARHEVNKFFAEEKLRKESEKQRFLQQQQLAVLKSKDSILAEAAKDGDMRRTRPRADSGSASARGSKSSSSSGGARSRSLSRDRSRSNSGDSTRARTGSQERVRRSSSGSQTGHGDTQHGRPRSESLDRSGISEGSNRMRSRSLSRSSSQTSLGKGSSFQDLRHTSITSLDQDVGYTCKVCGKEFADIIVGELHRKHGACR
eukprot:m.579122 g.579122  ORF g.579122 m.579122 type:complete len:876 (+) comp22313_c0_seq4:218-2845(+)